MSTDKPKPKPTEPIACIECGEIFTTNPALKNHRCPRCSRVPSAVHRERLGEWARQQFTEASQRYFGR
jgi:hypothetical protein